MPRYVFKAYNGTGTLATGEIAAETREGALEALARRGQIPFDLNEAQSAREVQWWQREVLGSNRLSSRNLSMFTRELASLTAAELPIDEALRIVAVQPMLGSRVRAITASLLERVREGEALSDALSAEGKAFPEYYTRLVKSGETSGSLAGILANLAKVTERAAETRAKVGAALVYPFVLLLAALAAIGVILTVLVPSLLPIFADAGVEPPFLIRALAGVSNAISTHWMILLGCGLAVAAGIAVVLQTPAGALSVDRAMLKVPLLGTLIERRETARLARTLSVLFGNGVPILETMRIAGGVLTNATFRHAVQTAAAEIKEGGMLSVPLARSGIFPELFVRLTAIGEKTGQLESMQLRAAEIYEGALERQIERMTALITPVLTIVVGAIAGGLIVSVMGAIFSVNDVVLK